MSGDRALVLDRPNIFTETIVAIDLATGDRTLLSGDGTGAGPCLCRPRGLAIAGARALVFDTSFEKRGLAIDLSTGKKIELTEEACMRAAVKYGAAIRKALGLGDYIRSVNEAADRDYEIELSVDETDQPTTLAEHYIIADQCLRGGMKLVSLLIHVVRRVDREESKTGRDSDIDVLGCFEVISVGPDGSCPTGGLGTVECIVHHLLCGSLRTIHFANRLLRENGRYPIARAFHRFYMAWSRQPDSISKSKTGR